MSGLVSRANSKAKQGRFKVGDRVEPVPHWKGKCVPSGRVVKIDDKWGGGQVIYVEGDHRGFVDYVFEKAPS